MFYQQLSKYYDKVFPFKPAVSKFLLEELPASGRILDAACGTGTYSIELAKNGYSVIGIDLEKKMIELAKKKDQDNLVDFFVYDMLSIDDFNLFNGVICLGNSLAHLPSLFHVDQFIGKCFEQMANKGKVIIQIVNFERILNNGPTDLPILGDESVEFRRTYIPEADGKIKFKSKLILKSTNTIYNNAISLNPIKKEELISILKDTGFSYWQLYGDYFKNDYSPSESQSTVVVASKG